MSKLLLLSAMLFFGLSNLHAQVKIGSPGIPNTNAVLELDGGTSKGLLLPKLTNTEMIALNTAPDGLVVYNKTDNYLYLRKSAAWQKVSDETNGGGGLTLPYAGTASTVGGAEFSITHTTTFGDAVYFNNTGGGAAVTTAAGNNKFNMTSGNTGIGLPAGITNNPTLGKLVVRGTVGAVSAMFGDNTSGVSVMNNFPSIGFNYYFNAGNKAISTGYGSTLGQDPANGRIYLSSSAASVNGAGAAMPLVERMVILPNGNIGLGVATPASPLSFPAVLSKKISLYPGATGDAGFGVFGNELRINSDNSSADITFGYDNFTNGFAEKMRIKGNGNVGIGIAAPTRPLSFPPIEGKKISLYPGATGDVGLSVQPNELRMYTDNSNATITMGYDNFTNGFKETFRINPVGSTVTTNPVALATAVENAAYFKTSTYYTGAIKSIGTDASHARLSFFGYASAVTTGLKEYLSIADDGNIGIGITTPSRPLSFPAVLEKKISLYPGPTGDAGFGVFGNELRINSDNANADITFGYDNFTNGFSEKVRMKGNGNVGIGVNNPNRQLDITGRMRIRGIANNIFNTAGIYFDGIASAERSFIGTLNENNMGLYSGAGAGWGFLMDVNDGAIMIGTTQKAAGYKVNVAGKIIAEEVRVQLKAAWPDYVFDDQYKKLSLDELEKYVAVNKHLPNIPSASDIEKDGQQLGEVQRKMLEKIEELSLYIIELKKEVDMLKNKN